MSGKSFEFKILWAGWEGDFEAEVEDGILNVSGKEWNKSDLKERIAAYRVALVEAQKALELMNESV